MTAAQPVNVAASRWSNQGPPAGFGGEYSSITGLKHGRILIQASQDEANLIAAAPELLEVLQQIIGDGLHCDVVPHLHAKAIAAISKATGGLPQPDHLQPSQPLDPDCAKPYNFTPGSANALVAEAIIREAIDFMESFRDDSGQTDVVAILDNLEDLARTLKGGAA